MKNNSVTDRQSDAFRGLFGINITISDMISYNDPLQILIDPDDRRQPLLVSAYNGDVDELDMVIGKYCTFDAANSSR